MPWQEKEYNWKKLNSYSVPQVACVGMITLYVEFVTKRVSDTLEI